jgi:hypothetical protein
MTTLERIWNSIQPRVGEGIDGRNVVAKSFLYPWNHDNADMDRIVQAIDIYKPKTVIELGTFEGWGTERIAEAMKKGWLFTFDAGKAPITMGLPYGVTEEYLIDGCLVDWENIPFEGWESFGDVIKKRQSRFERLKISVPKVKIVFVEGITWNTLPVWMPMIKTWDFMFQDSAHELETILQEWNEYSEYSKVGSVIVLDDVYDDSGTEAYFKENEPNWFWIHTDKGHHQLWGERIR